MERTLLDYIEDYSEGFFGSSRLFLNWIQFKGYIDTTYHNDLYLMNYNQFHWIFKPLGNWEWKEKWDKLKIAFSFDEDKEVYTNNKIDNPEDALKIFITTLFSHIKWNENYIWKFERINYKKVNKEECIDFFRIHAPHYRVNDVNNFLNDLDMWLSTFDKNHVFYTIKDVKNVNWKDNGVVIINGRDMESCFYIDEIIFYQIGDDN